MFTPDVPLAQRTTLGLGGPARWFARCTTEAEVRGALLRARDLGLAVTVLGGGSNVVVADNGIDGLVLEPALRGLALEDASASRPTRLRVAAGEPWDEVVAFALAHGLAGLECLSGIPGSAGAVPVQNVGAYGQEVAALISQVRALDRGSLEIVGLGPAELAFGYRDSALRRDPDRWLVLEVVFDLEVRATGRASYAELARTLGRDEAPLAELRTAVLALRRSKSMVLDPADENRRSVGSFWKNPVVAAEHAERIAEHSVAAGFCARPEDLPRFPADARRTSGNALPTGASLVKLPAAWLVERAGFTRGFRRGSIGLSSKHALALVHHGGGSSEALVELAHAIRDSVDGRFGIRLEPEPMFLGFATPPF